jgi:hypothetical protein
VADRGEALLDWRGHLAGSAVTYLGHRAGSRILQCQRHRVRGNLTYAGWLAQPKTFQQAIIVLHVTRSLNLIRGLHVAEIRLDLTPLGRYSIHSMVARQLLGKDVARLRVRLEVVRLTRHVEVRVERCRLVETGIERVRDLAILVSWARVIPVWTRREQSLHVVCGGCAGCASCAKRHARQARHGGHARDVSADRVRGEERGINVPSVFRLDVGLEVEGRVELGRVMGMDRGGGGTVHTGVGMGRGGVPGRGLLGGRRHWMSVGHGSQHPLHPRVVDGRIGREVVEGGCGVEVWVRGVALWNREVERLDVRLRGVLTHRQRLGRIRQRRLVVCAEWQWGWGVVATVGSEVERRLRGGTVARGLARRRVYPLVRLGSVHRGLEERGHL